MGLSDNPTRDSYEFRQDNPAVRYLIQAGFHYAELNETAREQVRNLVTTLIEESRQNCPDLSQVVAFGWKRAIMTYACEIFLDAYPSARTVHLIRDGRDAMLSRLRSRMAQLDDPINRLVVFGNPGITHYRDKAINQQVVNEYRNEFEMHHWVTAVRFGMRARRYGDRYLEVRYEDLCRDPENTMAGVFEFLDVPFLASTRDWVKANASVRSVGKWRGREEELKDAIQIGEPLLTELGYA